MQQKNIEVQSQKVQIQGESILYSKNVKNLVYRLREEIDQLFSQQEKAKTKKWKFHEEYKRLKLQGEEKDADFQYQSFRTWSDEEKRLIEKIQVKLKAVQKFETLKNSNRPRILDKKKQQLKYGPSDEEE